MFAFEIVVNQGGKSCFAMCVTQQTQAQESALICLPASTHKDLCKSMRTQKHSCPKTLMFTRSKACESRQAHDTDEEKSLRQLM